MYSNLRAINPPRENLTPLFIQQVPQIEAVREYLVRKGKQPPTIKTYMKALKELGTRANLKNTIEVETAIASYMRRNPITKEFSDIPASNKWKNQCVLAYQHYCKLLKIEWLDIPKFKVDEHSIQPPTQEKCAILLASARSELSLKIDISIQTGLRPVEIVGKYGTDF